jgi:putative sterol carrier protein
MATQTEENSTEKRIENAIDESVCKQRFQEFTEKRNEKIYKKIKFNIRNYVVLSIKEINEIRLLDEKQKIDIIILMNTAIKHLLEFI